MSTFARHPLAVAVFAAFSLSTLAPLHATQLIVTDGEQPATGTYDTTGMADLEMPFALAAFNAGSTINGANVTAITAADSASTLAAGNGGRINLTDVSVQATGADSYGVVASQFGSVGLTRATVDVSGASAHGVIAIAAGAIKLADASIKVADGVGLGAADVGSSIKASKTTIRAAGGNVENHGVSARNGGRIVLDQGSSVEVLSGYSEGGGVGLEASGTGSEVRATDTTVTTHGGYGVVASYGGKMSLDGTVVDTTGVDEGAVALFAADPGSQVTVANSTLRSHGATQSATGTAVVVVNGARVDLGEGTKVHADGEGAYVGGYGSKLHADGASITSAGLGMFVEGDGEATLSNGASVTGSRGILVWGSAGAKLIGNNASIHATGDHGTGVTLTRGWATLDLTDSTVEAVGPALYFGSSSAADKPNTAIISGGRLSSTSAAAILADDDPYDTLNNDNSSELLLRNGVQITGANNQLVRVAAGAQAVHLNIVADHVALAGDMVAERGTPIVDPGVFTRTQDGILDLALSNGSSLLGSVEHGNKVALDQTSRWDITRSSDVRNLRSAGTLAFVAPAAGDFKTLTVDGDYVGEGGTLAINTALAGDGSKTDRLVVHGATSGTTTLAVTNAGGAGAPTSDGIQVVQVDGASQGTFDLSGRVVAGAYEYSLSQGGKATPTDGDWYLRSELQPVVVPPVVVPPAVVPPVVDPPIDPIVVAPPAKPVPLAPIYRPEIGAYLGNQHAAVAMFNHTMHDRVGQPTFADDSRSDERGGAAWVRVGHNQFDATTGASQVDTATDTDLLQLGGEMVSWTAGDSRFHVGAMGGWGRANTHVGSEVTGYGAKGRVTGYNLGVYGTWFANAGSGAGLYIDGSLQGGRFSNRVEGDYLPRESYDSQSVSASLETGYAIALLANETTELYLQPQAQVIYTGYKADQHVESNGSLFTSEDAGGWASRVGARLYGNAAGAGINRVQPFLELNWWHAGEGDSITLGGQRVDWDLPQDVYEAKLGAQVELGGKWSGWGNIGAEAGAGEFRTVDGEIGLMRRW